MWNQWKSDMMRPSFSFLNSGMRRGQRKQQALHVTSWCIHPHLFFKSKLRVHCSNHWTGIKKSPPPIMWLLLYSYFFQIETFPPGERKGAHKTQEANGTCKLHKPQDSHSPTLWLHNQETMSGRGRNSVDLPANLAGSLGDAAFLCHHPCCIGGFGWYSWLWVIDTPWKKPNKFIGSPSWTHLDGTISLICPQCLSWGSRHLFRYPQERHSADMHIFRTPSSFIKNTASPD